MLRELKALPVQVLIESDWNLKLDIYERQLQINKVLIESDWNLKYFRNSLKTAGFPVLIESDWNLKMRPSARLPSPSGY